MCLAWLTGATGASSWPTPGRRPGHARRASQRVRGITSAPDRGAGLREGTEGGQEPGRRDWASRCMSFRASPVGGRNCRWTVVMVRFGNRITRKKSRSPSPSLGDPCTELCVTDRSLSHALQMQSDPKFHRQSPETPLLITIRCQSVSAPHGSGPRGALMAPLSMAHTSRPQHQKRTYSSLS
jgi:hypothetical protein